MPTALLSAPAGAAADDLRGPIAAAGLAVADHVLGSTPAVDFGPVAAAVVDPGGHAEVAAAQTRRWRIELGDAVVPVLWVLPFASPPEHAALGLDAGADAVLARPVEPAVLAAQLRAMARVHAAAARTAAKADEARLLGDQLRKAYARLDRDREAARRVHRALRPHALPEVGSVRVAVCSRPRGRAGGDFFDVRRLDEAHLGFALGDVLAHDAAAGSLLAVFARQAVRMKDVTAAGYRLVPPDEVLAGVNRELIGLGLDEPPLVALLAGQVNSTTGAVTLARAGGPAPVWVPASGEVRAWTVPGPFLGTADTTYQCVTATLGPGDKLLLGSDGTRPDGSPADADPGTLLAAADRHRALAGQAFVDAVARELLPRVEHGDDFTVLCVERA